MGDRNRPVHFRQLFAVVDRVIRDRGDTLTLSPALVSVMCYPCLLSGTEPRHSGDRSTNSIGVWDKTPTCWIVYYAIAKKEGTLRRLFEPDLLNNGEGVNPN